MCMGSPFLTCKNTGEADPTKTWSDSTSCPESPGCPLHLFQFIPPLASTGSKNSQQFSRWRWEQLISLAKGIKNVFLKLRRHGFCSLKRSSAPKALQREGLFQLQNTHTAPWRWVTVPRMAGGIGGTPVKTSVRSDVIHGRHTCPLDNTSSWKEFSIIGSGHSQLSAKDANSAMGGWFLPSRPKWVPSLRQGTDTQSWTRQGCLSHLPLSFETSDLHSGCRQLHTAQILQPPPKLQCHCTCC